MKDNQIDMITELLIDFDEMGFAPTTLCPDPEAYAIEWRKKLTEELKGYRKASEVAREIFEEIEEVIAQSNEISDIRMRELAPHTYKVMREAGKLYYTAIIRAIAELKKKYTEGAE